VVEPKFGWLSPVAAHAGSDFEPIVMYQDEHILPSVLPHFDSVWIADHFYGFDPDKLEGFLEAWTSLTWLAARYPDIGLCHHVLGHGYRNPALTAKMASTLQVLSGGRFMLGIGAGWREDEYRSYGYEFPKVSVRLRQLEEVVQICRLMWIEPHPTFTGRYFRIDDAAATPRPDTMPKICIGSSGEQIGLPIVGRRADVWNGPYYGSDDDWRRKREIVDRAKTRDVPIIQSQHVDRGTPREIRDSACGVHRDQVIAHAMRSEPTPQIDPRAIMPAVHLNTRELGARECGEHAGSEHCRDRPER